MNVQAETFFLASGALGRTRELRNINKDVKSARTSAEVACC